MIQTSLRLPNDLYLELVDYAKQTELSQNQIIKKALRELLHQNKIEREIKGEKIV